MPPDPGAAVGSLSAERQLRWKPLVAFVHIPRTGGGSVTSAISRAYGRAKSAGNVQISAVKSHRLLQRVAQNLDTWSGRALADHVPYGLYALYLPSDTRYVTFLRDPVERVLSHYHFHARAGPEKLRVIWRRDWASAGEGAAVGDDDDTSLEAGLARGITIYNNLATRFLWGGESLEGELPPDALQRAKEALDRFAFVGVTERLDEAIVLLGRMLDVPLAGYHLRHVREGRPTANDVPADLRRLIEKHNALDIELYRIARERFASAAAQAGDVSGEIDELRRRRVEVTEQAETRRAARRAAAQAERKAAKRGRSDEGGVLNLELALAEVRDELEALGGRLRAIEAGLATAGREVAPRATGRAGRGDRPPKARKRGRDESAPEPPGDGKRRLRRARA